jgi:hypothetical protein
MKIRRNQIIVTSTLVIALTLLLIHVIGCAKTHDEVIIVTPETAESTTISTAETTTAKSFVTTTSSQIAPPQTEPPTIEAIITMAEIITTISVQAEPVTPRTRTTSAPIEQLTPDSTTYIDGQKYAWDPVIGWIMSSGDGTVIIMNVESDGRMYEGGWGSGDSGQAVAETRVFEVSENAIGIDFNDFRD